LAGFWFMEMNYRFRGAPAQCGQPIGWQVVSRVVIMARVIWRLCYANKGELEMPEIRSFLKPFTSI